METECADRSQVTESIGFKDAQLNLSRLSVMPARLVLVRHGESDANIINRRLKIDVNDEYPAGFSAIPDREIRLSDTGRAQAGDTGRWLREQYPEGFDVIYTSDHTRAKETAAHLCIAAGWEDAAIRIDPLVGERNWGRFSTLDGAARQSILQLRSRDPLHAPMPDGESLLETRHRSRELLDRCARHFAGKRVLVISHGEFIEALWAEVAHMNTERQIDFFSSEKGNIRNGQVVEFSSQQPTDSQPSPRLQWIRSSSPSHQVLGDWGVIERNTFSPSELLQQAARYPQFSL